MLRMTRDSLQQDSSIGSGDVPLPLRRGETYQDRERIDELLSQHWRGERAWLRDENEKKKLYLTYGEVTPLGARQLMALLELERVVVGGEAYGDHVQEDPIIFYDLGSGAGKLVVQMILENVVTASVGVELSQARHSLAMEAWSDLQNSLSITSEDTTYECIQDGENVKLPRVQFLNLDILDTDFSDATHLFVSSVCFPEDVVEKTGEIILRNCHQYGKLQVVVALSNVRSLEGEENRKYWKKSFEVIEMTWGYCTARVYKYIG